MSDASVPTFGVHATFDDEAIQGASVSSGPPGASAYQLAKAEGFEGTLEEWLATLVGPVGGAITITAQGPIGGDRAVTVSGEYCDPNTPASLASYAGVTTRAMNDGDTQVVLKSGLHVVADGRFLEQAPVYIGEAGVLVQTPPSGHLRRIGWAVSEDTIHLDTFPTIRM